MDLNHLYSQHQLSLMGAATTTSCRDHARHVADAGAFARRIHDFQLARGASAAKSWDRGWLPRNSALDGCQPAGLAASA